MTKETLASLAAELETCGKTLLKIAEAMKIKEEAPTPEPPKNEPGSTKLTLEEVRKVAADKSRQGFTDEVRGLIQKYGADKLSSMDPEKFEAFLKDLEVMGHAGEPCSAFCFFQLPLAGLSPFGPGMCQAAGCAK